MTQHLTTCTFCGVGCGLYLAASGNRIGGAYPSMAHPANDGRICVRGWNVHEVAGSPDRLTSPLIRQGDTLKPANWMDAVDFIATRLRKIAETHGPDAIGFLGSPRCSNEESYLLQKFARTVIGTNNIDHGLGEQRNNTIEVFLDQLGIPAATNPIADLARADVILVDGADLSIQLPTIGGHVIRAKRRGAKVIVIDPRRHRVAEHADWFLQIKPGHDILLHGALAKVIVDRGLANLPFIRERCENWEPFLAALQSHDLVRAAEACEVPASAIEEAAIAFAKARSAMILYSTGVETRGAAIVKSLVNLALLTGNIGRPGAGIMPLAEQNNLQGNCDMGMSPTRLPGYAPIANPEERERFKRLWKVAVPARPGLGAKEMLAGAAQGTVKALWINRHDPTFSASSRETLRALANLELLVVQHLFMTGTAACADVVLPLVAFGEERVTFTSTERRIQVAEKVIDPPHGPLPAWREIVEIANRLSAGWRYRDAGDVMLEIGQAVPFYSGATHENLMREYGRQWPCTRDEPLGTPRLFERAAERRFRFAEVPAPAGALACADKGFPFSLMFGRSLYYWHRNILVQNSETLKREYRSLLLDFPKGFVDINPEDARAIGVREHQSIRLVSALGEFPTTARLTHEVKPGMIYVPYFLHEIAAILTGESESDAGSLSRPICIRVEKN